MEIIKDGIYLFADGKVVVIDGKISDASNNGLIYGKGYQVSDDQGYRAQKVKTFTTSLELWSQKRDEQISQANTNIANSLRQNRNLPMASFMDVWLWSPIYASFIYMPGGRYRSPYGYIYQSVGQGYYGGRSVSNDSGGGGSNGGGGGGSSSASNASSGGGGGGAVSYSSGVAPSGGGSGASSSTPSAGAQAGAPAGHSTSLGK